MANNKYAALICDIIDSRKYASEDRRILQNILIASIDYLNLRFSKSIKKTVCCSAGDSVQGLFLNVKSAYCFASILKNLLYPVRIRVGIGYGKIDYDNNLNTNELTGEAYYFAKEAIDNIPYKKDLIFIKTGNESDRLISSYSYMLGDYMDTISPIERLCLTVLDIYYPRDKASFEKNTEFLAKVLKIQHGYAKENSVLGSYEENVASGRFLYERSFFEEPLVSGLDLIEQFIRIKADEKNNENPLEFNDELPRGSTVLLATLLQTTKQNISQHLNNGVKQYRMYYNALIQHLK